MLQGGEVVLHRRPESEIAPQQQALLPPGRSWQLVPPQEPQEAEQQHSEWSR